MLESTKNKTLFTYTLLLVLPQLFEWYINSNGTSQFMQAFKRMLLAFYDLLPLIITVVIIILFIGFILTKVGTKNG